MNKDNIFDIQMFAEGAAEGGTDGTAAESGLTGDFNADFQKYFGTSAGAGSAPVSHKTEAEAQAAASGTDAQNEAEESSEAADENAAAAEENSENEFEALIKGKHKKDFQKRVQGIINDRFKNAKATAGKLDAMQEAIAPLFARYGLNESDVEGLGKAIKEDTSIFTRLAMEKGIDAEEFRDSFYADRESKQKTEREDRERALNEARARYDDWKKQEAEIQKTYPSFNLQDAFRNEDFRNMAMQGATILNAYRASHFDEIAAGLVAATSKRTVKQTVDSMQSSAGRPREGGLSSSAATVSKKDVGNLSEADIFDIIKRVGRGEKITF